MHVARPGATLTLPHAPPRTSTHLSVEPSDPGVLQTRRSGSSSGSRREGVHSTQRWWAHAVREPPDSRCGAFGAVWAELNGFDSGPIGCEQAARMRSAHRSPTRLGGTDERSGALSAPLVLLPTSNTLVPSSQCAPVSLNRRTQAHAAVPQCPHSRSTPLRPRSETSFAPRQAHSPLGPAARPAPADPASRHSTRTPSPGPPTRTSSRASASSSAPSSSSASSATSSCPPSERPGPRCVWWTELHWARGVGVALTVASKPAAHLE